MRFVRKHYIAVGIILVILLVVVVAVVARNGDRTDELFVVKQMDLVDEVRVSGRIEADIVSDLGFEVSGSVVSIPVRVGQRVETSQALVLLSLGTLPAELSSAKAEVNIKQAQTGSTEASLEAVTAQQNTLVENARRALFSDGLITEPASETTTITPPTISGTYTGPEGQYVLRVRRGITNTKFVLLVRGVESPSYVDMNNNENITVPLGSYGLRVSFPGDLNNYIDEAWTINIPNTTSSSYVSNINTYEKTLRDRDVAIEEAQSKLSVKGLGVSVSQAELAKAQADVSRITAEIEKRVLRAPFTGIVSAIDIDPGEIISANKSVIQVISSGDFGVEIDLPEIDSVKVRPGNKASVTLDAFGEEVVFRGTVVSVNNTETLIDNVAVYEARIIFDNNDERISSGMTAEVTIATNEKTNVLAVPARALKTAGDGSRYVIRKKGESEEEVTVITGLRGSDSFIEIVSGLNEGDIIAIP